MFDKPILVKQQVLQALEDGIECDQCGMEIEIGTRFMLDELAAPVVWCDDQGNPAGSWSLGCQRAFRTLCMGCAGDIADAGAEILRGEDTSEAFDRLKKQVGSEAQLRQEHGLPEPGARFSSERCPRCSGASFAHITHAAAREVLLGGMIKARLTPVAYYCSNCAHLWADLTIKGLEEQSQS